MTSRAEIAAALSRINGIEGHEYPPTAIQPGHGWPVLVLVEPAGYCAYTLTWDVFVATGGSGIEDQARKADELYEPIDRALGTLGRVVQLEPVLYQQGDTPNGVPSIRARITTK